MSTEDTAKTAEDTIARLMEADKKPRRYLECYNHAVPLYERIFSMTCGTPA